MVVILYRTHSYTFYLLYFFFNLNAVIWPLSPYSCYCYKTNFAQLLSKPNAETLGFVAKKEFIHKAAKQGDRRTSHKSTSLKVRSLRFLWAKEAGWSLT